MIGVWISIVGQLGTSETNREGRVAYTKIMIPVYQSKYTWKCTALQLGSLLIAQYAKSVSTFPWRHDARDSCDQFRSLFGEEKCPPSSSFGTSSCSEDHGSIMPRLHYGKITSERLLKSSVKDQHPLRMSGCLVLFLFGWYQPDIIERQV